MPKERVDKLLVARGLCESRERAQALVMAGQVYAADQKVVKPATQVELDCPLEVRQGLAYVSRGGLKLEKALDSFGLEVSGRAALDIGASTGGFTDCLLQRGARSVMAVDVGKGQLAWKLRQDARVHVLEKVNARYLTAEQLPTPVEAVTADVSFISLELILEPVARLLAPEAWVVTLVKPQFEAGRRQVGKGGVVRDPSVHQQVIEKVMACGARLGLVLSGLTHSPIQGPAGNIEYLLAFGGRPIDTSAEAVVRAAHLHFREQGV
ncbi:MAG: TlyA family RNA methyltransferase [Vulcanimicrobiota bacterium]